MIVYVLHLTTTTTCYVHLKNHVSKQSAGRPGIYYSLSPIPAPDDFKVFTKISVTMPFRDWSTLTSTSFQNHRHM